MRLKQLALRTLVPVAALGLLYGALRLLVFDVATLKHVTHDMWPLASTGATVVINRRATIERGDVVAMKREGSGLMLRRVIGLPHETLWFIDSRPYFLTLATSWTEVGRFRQDDRWFVVQEERLGDARYLVIDDVRRRMSTYFSVDTGDGYYVLADNREHLEGKDSRTLGPIARSDIRGVVSWIIDPGDELPVYYPVDTTPDAGVPDARPAPDADSSEP